MALRDKEDLKKKLEIKDTENMKVTLKEEELHAKIDDMQTHLKEKDNLLEKKVEESFNLKQKID